MTKSMSFVAGGVQQAGDKEKNKEKENDDEQSESELMPRPMFGTHRDSRYLIYFSFNFELL